MKNLRLNIMKVDVISDHGYMYPKDVMEKAIKNFNAKWTEDNPCFCDNRSRPKTDILKVSHIMKNMSMDDYGIVSADIVLMDTPNGQILQDLHDSEVELKCFSNGIATVDVVEEVETVTDYRYLSVTISQRQEK